MMAAGVLAALLGALYVLRALGVTPLLAWCLPIIDDARYPFLFASYFLTWWLARGAHRRSGMLAGSMITAAIMDPTFLGLSVLWICGLHALLPRLRRALVYVLATYAVAAIACTRELGDVDPDVARWGYLLAVSYTFRIAWLLHQLRLHREERVALADMMLYFVFAPFFVIVPYMIAIPRFGRFRASLDRHDVAIERSGMKMIAWGILLSIATWVVRGRNDLRTGRRSIAPHRSPTRSG